VDFRTTKDGHTFPLTPAHPALSSAILNNKTESHSQKFSRLKQLHDFTKKRKELYSKSQKKKKETKDSERLGKINEMQSTYFKIIENNNYTNKRRLMLLHSLQQEYKKDLKKDKYLSSQIDAEILKLTNIEQSEQQRTSRNTSDNRTSHNRTSHNRTSHNETSDDGMSWDKFPTKSGELLDVGENSKITARDILMMQSAGIIDPEIQIPEDE
jgi:hypothetical protein